MAKTDDNDRLRKDKLPKDPGGGTRPMPKPNGAPKNGHRAMDQGAPPPTDDDFGEPMDEPAEGEREERKSQAQQIVDDIKNEMSANRLELFHAPDQEGFLSAEVAGHWETWPIRSSAAGSFLRRRFYTKTDGRTPSAQAIADARAMLDALALFDGGEFPVFTRIARDQEKIYIDLGDEKWRVVEMDADGWRILGGRPPVRFVRKPGMLPLPLPVQSDDGLSRLRGLLNVDVVDAVRSDFVLVAAWLAAALRPRGPYPVLVVHGEQGSGKTTVARMLRRLIDPNKAESRAEPRNEEDLILAATNGWIIAIDNVSRMHGWLSDSLCRLATGTGFGKRRLYTDGEETIFEAQRPIILNGIEEVATRGDLLSRAIVIRLPIIDEDKRQTEEELWQRFESAAPVILGALLDAVVMATRQLPTTKLAKLPRMADFARCSVAAGPALGFTEDDFLAAYSANRALANTTALEASVLVPPLEQLVASKGQILMTPTELLTALTERAADVIKRSPEWPRSAKALTGALHRLAPNLRAAGFTCTYERDKRRLWRIERVGNDSSEVSNRRSDTSGSPNPTHFADIRRPVTPEKDAASDASDSSDTSEPLSSGFQSSVFVDDEGDVLPPAAEGAE